jgi:IS66 Orf2 like protein
MITIPAGARILLATRPIDFRKGAHGLAALAQEVLAEDPFSGAVIVYRAKRSDRVKILVWDSSGLVLIWNYLASYGSGSRKPIKKRAHSPIKDRDHAHVQLLNLSLRRLRRFLRCRSIRKHRRQAFQGLLLPFPHHRMVDAMLGCQLGRRQLTAQRLKRNLRLEIRRIPLPFARHPSPSFSGANRAYRSGPH